MYNFNLLGLKLNRPHDLHLYTIVRDLDKAMDKIKNLSTLLLQIVDIRTLYTNFRAPRKFITS